MNVGWCLIMFESVLDCPHCQTLPNNLKHCFGLFGDVLRPVYTSKHFWTFVHKQVPTPCSDLLGVMFDRVDGPWTRPNIVGFCLKKNGHARSFSNITQQCWVLFSFVWWAVHTIEHCSWTFLNMLFRNVHEQMFRNVWSCRRALKETYNVFSFDEYDLFQLFISILYHATMCHSDWTRARSSDAKIP